MSECSRIPASLRPLSSAATPWEPSWAMVTTCRLTRHVAGRATSARTTSPTTEHGRRVGPRLGADHLVADAGEGVGELHRTSLPHP